VNFDGRPEVFIVTIGLAV